MFSLTLAFFLYAWAALWLGYMVYAHRRGLGVSSVNGALRGVLVLATAIALGVGLSRVTAGGAWVLAGGLLLAEAAGAYLFYRHVRGESWPAPVVWGHAGLSALTLVLLGLWTFGAIGGPDTPVLPESPQPGNVDGALSETSP